MAEKKNPEFSSKAMLAEHASKGTKVHFAERMEVEILHDTKFYRAGQIINPHKVKGQALIDQKIAKKVVKE